MQMLVFEGVDVVERFVMVGQREVFDGLCEGGRLWASKGLSVWRRGFVCRYNDLEHLLGMTLAMPSRGLATGTS